MIPVQIGDLDHDQIVKKISDRDPDQDLNYFNAEK